MLFRHQGRDARRRRHGRGAANALWITLSHECLLDCSYCYIRGRRQSGRIEPDQAETAIKDFIHHTKANRNKPLQLRFIGGEPFLDPSLIDEIYRRFLDLTRLTDHPWRTNHRIMVTTSGVVRDMTAVRELLLRYSGKMSITVSLDGNETGHDAHRRRRDGSGSYRDALKMFFLCREAGADVAVNCVIAPDMANEVFEIVTELWTRGIDIESVSPASGVEWDDRAIDILEAQAVRLADYMIHNEIAGDRKNAMAFFIDERMGWNGRERELEQDCFAATNAMAVDVDGRYYPCYRMLPMMNGREVRTIGDVSRGIVENLIRPFAAFSGTEPRSRGACGSCTVRRGCRDCPAENLTSSLGRSIFESSYSACDLHKALARVGAYYRKQKTEIWTAV